jgi:hypothetical protein
MRTGAPRWLVPLLAALAVLAVVGVSWQVRPGGEQDAGFADGGDSGQGSPPYAGTEPGSPGVGEPSPDEPGSSPGSGTGRGSGDVAAGAIAVSSFYSYDATHLAINYTNGVPECYGDAGTPKVEESPDAVVVTIPRIPVKSTGDRACIDIALLGSVGIALDSPLAGRPVLDGSRDGARVEEAAAPFSSDQAK